MPAMSVRKPETSSTRSPGGRGGKSHGRDPIPLAVHERQRNMFDMERSWLRRMLTPLLGLVFAVSMGASAVQASDMVVRMAMASAMGAAGDGRCQDCFDGAPDAKATDCAMAFCTLHVVASLPHIFVMVGIDSSDRPVLAQPSLVGWASPPDPYPPRPDTLG